MIDKGKVKNILVTRTDRLGDVMLTLPLISCLRKIFPGAKIYFLVKKYLKGLLECYDGIDEIIYEDDHEGNVLLKEIINKKNIDLSVNVKPDFRQAFMFYRLGIKYRIGTAYRWYSFLYNCKVYEHRKNSDKHESELNVLLIRNFFNEKCDENINSFRIDINKKDELKKKLISLNKELKRKYIIVHPGSGGSAKDLPAGKFSELLKTLRHEFKDHSILLTGIKSERELEEKIISDSGSADAVNLCGELSLRELLTLIDECSLFISNSTGPIHIAGILNKKIIGFYPNEKPMHAGRWKPLGKNVVIFSPESPDDDMNEINIDEAVISAKKFLNS
ncbi:MAG: glycosyltransferase family 9 protein [Ignavibacteria bacterium]|nr:glycosyltransferase family 9 protein [Ignavibacteria bacterium]